MAKPISVNRKAERGGGKQRDQRKQPTRAHDGVHQRDQADEQKAAMRQQPQHLPDEGDLGGLVGSCRARSRGPGLADQKPGDGRRQKTCHPRHQEWRGKAVGAGQQSARKRSDAKTKKKRGLIGRDVSPAPVGRTDIGEHDLANRQNDAGAGARNNSRQDEFDKAMRFGAPETSDRRNQAADGEHGPPAPAVCQLSAGQDRHETAPNHRRRRQDRWLKPKHRMSSRKAAATAPSRRSQAG